MTTDYDPIAEKYKRAKLQPWRAHVESFTLLELVGDLAGRSVVDLACGEGYYTRRLRQRGAARALGVDLSEQMVKLARRQEAEHPIGVEYTVGDGRALQLGEQCDVAVAAYLLNYARDRQELAAMCRSVAGALKPGGRFVAVNTSPGMDFRAAPSYRPYGFETRMEGGPEEGTPIVWTFHLDSGSFSIENYFIDVPTHEEAFRSAGFREVRWHRPRLSPEGAAEHGRDFWTTFLDRPPIMFTECVK
jgi:ubiquinone/menaquinone biosynthesis C-methylase UbiE